MFAGNWSGRAVLAVGLFYGRVDRGRVTPSRVRIVLDRAPTLACDARVLVPDLPGFVGEYQNATSAVVPDFSAPSLSV